MLVRVAIRASRPRTGITIPVAAVLRDDENLPFVYVAVTGGTFDRRRVDLGGRVGDRYEVASGLKPGEFSPVFDVVMPNGTIKAGLLQLLSRNESGEWTLDETRQRIRTNLQQAGSWRRLLDQLRAETYVSIRM